ncbi:MAG: DUF47 domain-containing protein [Phyllobacteriaceae bacterium]|nr:DUF47 domain-containing protein [Phyllobacteriaceae bacterium]
MFGFFKKLMPKEERFFDMFERHAALSVAGARALRAVLDGGDAIAANSAIVMKHEDDADHVTQDVMNAIHRSFITPFDRTDIKDLITAMDDALDQMNKTVKAIALFDVRSFDPEMRAMGDQIVSLAERTAEALPLMRNIGGNSARLHELTGEIVRVEGENDHTYDAGLKALLAGPAKSDAMAWIVGSEIYAHLEKVGDRFEQVANTMSGIVIDHA